MTTQPYPENLQPQETPCPICGRQNYVWGRTIGEGQWIYFRASGGFWGDGEKLLAPKCLDCYNVQLFTSKENLF